MPTETQWECVCRAGSQTTYPHGENKDLLAQYANFGSQEAAMEPVGSRLPNGCGLFHMCGNAWEMCHDFYNG